MRERAVGRPTEEGFRYLLPLTMHPGRGIYRPHQLRPHEHRPTRTRGHELRGNRTVQGCARAEGGPSVRELRRRLSAVGKATALSGEYRRLEGCWRRTEAVAVTPHSAALRCFFSFRPFGLTQSAWHQFGTAAQCPIICFVSLRTLLRASASSGPAVVAPPHPPPAASPPSQSTSYRLPPCPQMSGCSALAWAFCAFRTASS